MGPIESAALSVVDGLGARFTRLARSDEEWPLSDKAAVSIGRTLRREAEQMPSGPTCSRRGGPALTWERALYASGWRARLALAGRS